jgi:hypothetical protein
LAELRTDRRSHRHPNCPVANQILRVIQVLLS